jgi:hypothetical protein
MTLPRDFDIVSAYYREQVPSMIAYRGFKGDPYLSQPTEHAPTRLVK